MADDLTLRVITPDRIVLDTQASHVQVPGTDGSLGILPRHAHMVAALDVGVLTYRTGGKDQMLFVSGGFVEVRNNTVRVVSEAGEQPEEIDEERAKEAEARARERLDEYRTGTAGEIDILRAEAALRRAVFRMLTKGRKRSLN